VSWISKYGQGHTFYCSLGHREEIYWNPVILKHYLAGFQYALGDVEADATPTATKDK
jgi:type 1 glutamine amidotransferase